MASIPTPAAPQKMAMPTFVVAHPTAPVKEQKKHIQFSPLVQVVLIPCLAEYREANVLPSMFWSSEDIKVFRMELLYAFKEYLMRTPCDGIDKKSALKRMLADESYEV